jgi:hypothetical protein
MNATVKLPRLNMLAVDLAASLFRLTSGDIDVEAESAETAYTFRVVDMKKFGEKLQALEKRANEIMPRIFNFLGGLFVARDCGVKTVQELAANAARDPEGVIRHLSAVREVVEKSGVVIEWGGAPLVRNPPPLLESVEFMEGARLWPAVQLDAEGSGARTRVKAGFRRSVRPSCLVVGALALGAAATYVAGAQRRGVIRFLIPLTPVEYDIATGGTAGRLTSRLGELGECDLPEPLMRLLVASLAGRPAVFRLADIAYTGGKDVKRDSSRELVIDTRTFGGGHPFKFLRELGRHAGALHGLARQWCSCDRRGWPRECGDVEQAGTAAVKVYLYADTGDLERAYEALSSLLRLSRDIAGGVERLVGGLVW